MMTKEVRLSLCPNCDSCPEVVVTDEEVTIGEEENHVRLTHDEWNVLVAAIKSGDLAATEEKLDAGSCC